ncbi:Hypp5406 [Branchiostoma lanceolatum]|uniref:Hypp5406 protein n=1 Tax=Branchiostoma lanceolatum TaxID=7740 RepID=A0A8K0AJI6_BRALA|nr:Hypp5406 [Branchiostoma lanceolatum]
MGVVVLFVLTFQIFLGTVIRGDQSGTTHVTIDDNLGTLASTYAPKVWLAKDEDYNPSSVGFHLENVKVYDGATSYSSTPSTLSTCSENCYMSSNQPLEHASATLPFFSGEQVGPSQQPPVYAVVKRINETATDILYWMFYPYNRGKNVCIGLHIFGVCIGGYSTFGNHVGDWEYATMRLVDGQPHQLFVSSHDFGGIYDWDAASQTYKKGEDAIQTEGTHPILYSALGSHGLWSTPGSHVYKDMPAIIDDLRDETSNGTAWDTWRNVTFTMYRPDGGYTGSWAWLNFKGRWGNRKAIKF